SPRGRPTHGSAPRRMGRCSLPAASACSTPTATSSTRASEQRSAVAAALPTSLSAMAPTRRTASVAEALPVLWQAEWCPFSSAVREVLTELGIHFVARQVEALPEDRSALREELGTDQIPSL